MPFFVPPAIDAIRRVAALLDQPAGQVLYCTVRQSTANRWNRTRTRRSLFRPGVVPVDLNFLLLLVLSATSRSHQSASNLTFQPNTAHRPSSSSSASSSTRILFLTELSFRIPISHHPPHCIVPCRCQLPAASSSRPSLASSPCLRPSIPTSPLTRAAGPSHPPCPTAQHTMPAAPLISKTASWSRISMLPAR